MSDLNIKDQSFLKGCFVTGTDTEVGKTFVSTGLLHALKQQGLRALGLKPVSAGMLLEHGQWLQEDVMALRAESEPSLPMEQHGPLRLRAACAPHIAAQLEDVSPHREALLKSLRHSASLADAVVVEGAGGFCVPMSPLGEPVRWGLDDLAFDLDLPVVMVVALRLGCLNHALLTAQAIQAKGLRLAGWVGNQLSQTPMPYQDENIATLQAWLNAPLLGVVPWMEQPSAAAVAEHLDARSLMSTLNLQARHPC